MGSEMCIRDRRKYGMAVLREAVEVYDREFIKERRALGELNHPDNRPFADPREAAILIESLDWQSNVVIGKAAVMDTHWGQHIKALMESNFKMGVSTRGLGKLTEQRGGYNSVDKYIMTAVDAVDNPSMHTAYVDMISESKVEWEFKDGIWKQKYGFNKLMLENNIDRIIETMKKLKH